MKKIIIYLIALITLLFSTVASAWEILREKDGFFLVDKKLSVKEKVFAMNENTMVEVLPLSEGLVILRYLESRSGTKDFTSTFNCAIYSSSSKKMLAVDQLCKTATIGPKGEVKEVSATFKLEKNNVSYSFEELQEKFSIK